MSGEPLTAFTREHEQFRDEVIKGLQQESKQIHCKYLYDERGSQLFEKICDLQEYYPTRTELGIMNERIGEMSECLGENCLLIEYGTGSGIKTRILLEALVEPVAYVPIEISCEQLDRAAAMLRTEFTGLEVLPVCADYTAAYNLPSTRRRSSRRVVYFPGSTIGNFQPQAATDFLAHVAEVCGEGGGMLIGVDIKKDPAVLEQAYDDAAGVTAAFNLNLLQRLNTELGADFDLDQFSHRAHYNAQEGRVEMHLVSKRRQHIHVAGEEIVLAEGESIHTENSYKYSLDQFADIAAEGGFRVARVWMDAARQFSVQYLEVI